MHWPFWYVKIGIAGSTILKPMSHETTEGYYTEECVVIAFLVIVENGRVLWRWLFGGSCYEEKVPGTLIR